MKLVSKPKGGQRGRIGGVVNVPSLVEELQKLCLTAKNDK